MSMNTNSNYVLVTPARNEGQFIELTIKSVVSQSRLPLKWVIVDDGSTDETAEIVARYAATNTWIELIRIPEGQERSFAGKVFAFNAGLQLVKDLPYEILGSLDADVSFESDYFEYLLTEFTGNPKLGVGGTPFTEGEGTYDFRFTSIEHVSGACQLFRRECFEAIGGYSPIAGGGIDLVAVVTARMRGWQTRTFTKRVCFHHRKMGSAINKGLRLPFKWGQTDYRLGGHPWWQLFRCVYQMTKKPYVVGGALCLAGYYLAFFSRRPRDVSDEFATFRGKEQMRRLKNLFGIDRRVPGATSERTAA
jgi:biofilm PGA synthesis N-glycosyltransferase PgaC